MQELLKNIGTTIDVTTRDEALVLLQSIKPLESELGKEKEMMN